jgi:hypothetical protein
MMQPLLLLWMNKSYNNNNHHHNNNDDIFDMTRRVSLRGDTTK